MFQYIKEKLSPIPKLKEWSKTAERTENGIELPVFSFQPQNYITQIGEHLFALTQQLAPFGSISSSIKESNLSSSSNSIDEPEDERFVSQWLEHVTSNTISLYLQKITQIKYLSPLGCKQLLSDISKGFLLPFISLPFPLPLPLFSYFLFPPSPCFENFLLAFSSYFLLLLFQ